MFLSFLQRAAWALLSVSSIADALNPQVNLGYATYEGTSLSNGVKQFLPMRYAAPPLKENRFRRAVAPLEETGVVMAKVAKEVCIFDFSFPNDIEDTDPDRVFGSMVQYVTVSTKFSYPRRRLQCLKAVST
jgi:hypothetical protein